MTLRSRPGGPVTDELELPYVDRRASDRSPNDYRGIWRRKLLPKGPARTVVISVVGTVIAASVVGALRSIPPVVFEPRFIRDSTRRDALDVRVTRNERRIDTLADQQRSLAEQQRFTNYMLCVSARRNDPASVPPDCTPVIESRKNK